LIIGITNVSLEDNMNAPSKVSFIVHKYKNGELNPLWNDIKNLRLIYVNEWRKYFEISLSVNISNENTKSVVGIALQESELSNLRLHDIEINTDRDIAREDYVVTTLYNSQNLKASLLNRLLSDKASHYKVIHVDSTIANLQRSFSFNDISIYDAFMEIEKELNCLFVFGEPSDETTMLRTISVYDLEQSCMDCGYRGEFIDKCPKCNSSNINEGYGEDTTIFLSRENLTEDIELSSDVDSVKNCFRLEAGDDLMTSTIINATPSGSQYLWKFSQDDISEMSDGLQTKITTYDNKYAYYQKEFNANINPEIINKYNTLINKYKPFNKALSPIITPITGFSKIMEIYYDVIDFHSYLYSSLMPNVEIEKTTASEQAALLTSKNLSPVSVQNIEYISLATANSTIISYAKIFVDSAKYKIKVKDSSISGTTWTGNFTVESYYDDEDIADSPIISIQFDDNYENFIKQKLDKALTKSKDDDLSIISLFKLENNDFTNELRKYSYTYLQLISDSCQSCLDILIEQGIADDEKWKYTEGNLYEKIYLPYYKKKELIELELRIRENELSTISGTTNEYGDVKTYGLKNYIDDIRNDILNNLDFEKHIGDYWGELSSFRREDIYSNDNYISDGLSNAELFENAQKFLSAAQNEINKASSLQHSISTTLKNLLIMKEFKPLVKYFKTGNWIRIEIDDEIYKLRLLSYRINYDSLDKISVNFSDVIKTSSSLFVTDVKSVLNQSKSMAKSYSSIKRQAEKGKQSKDFVDDWIQKGIDTTTTKIVNGEDQEIVYDKHGLLFRKYNSDEGTYSPKQLKILSQILAFTNDNWKTCKAALGEFEYYNPKTHQMETDYGLIASKIIGNIVLSEELGIYNKSGNMTFDENGLSITNGVNSFIVNPNEPILLSIKKGSVPVFTVTDTGELSFTGNVTTNDLSLGTNGLYENNGTTSISIAPRDISILTLQKGKEKVLFFDDSGDLNVKGKIVAQELTLGEDVKIDVSILDGMDDFIKTDCVIGDEPTQNNIGFLLTSAGILKSSNAELYNPTITTSNLTVTNGGIQVTNNKNESILWTSDSGNINMSDAWGNAGNVVLSGNENKVKIELNNDILEIWVDKTLVASFPKGYAPKLEPDTEEMEETK
jgi:hypothetical protein